MLKLIEGHYRALESVLPSEIEQAADDGPSAVVTAGTALQRHILRILAESSKREILPGLEIMPGLPQLVDRLSDIPAVRETVSPADRILLAMEAMRSIPAGRPYAALAGSPHAASALADFFEDELLDRGIDPEAYETSAAIASGMTGAETGGGAGLSSDSSTVESVMTAFGRYHEARTRLYPATHDVLAAGVLGRRSIPYRRIILYGFLDLNPLQRRLLKTLLGSGAVVVFFCPVPAALEQWQDIGRSTRRMLAAHGVPMRADSRGAPPPPFLEFADALLDGGGRTIPIPAGFRMIETSGAMGVARAVADEIGRATASGLSGRDIAVIGTGPAFGAVETLFRLENIPCTRPGGVPAGFLPVAALLRGLCRLRSSGYHHSVLLEIAGCGVLREDIEAAPDTIVEAVRTVPTRKGEVVLARLAALDPAGPLGPAGRFAAALSAADASIPDSAPPDGMLKALCRAARTLIAPGGLAETVLESLPRLSPVRHEAPITLPGLGGILDAILDGASFAFPGNPSGVDLMGFAEARGTSFRQVILFGLEEDVFPGFVRTDPRLPESLRTALELPPGRLRELEQALLFRQAFECAAESLTLVRMTNDSTGREVAWSPFIGPIVERDGGSARGGAGLQVVRSSSSPLVVLFGGGGRSRADIIAASRGELPLHRPFFAEAFAAEESRYDFSAPFGPFDGMIGSAASDPPRAFSPSGLEKWIGCPFRYLVEQVWGLDDGPGAASTSVPPPDVSGAVIHAALAGCLAHASASALEALELEAERRNLAGIMGSSELARLYVESTAPKIERVLAFLRDNGLAPDGAGSLEAGREGYIDEAGARLRGRIDMILSDGSGRWVLDLKTGRPAGMKELQESAAGPLSLQIPVYAAIMDSTGDPVSHAGLLYMQRPSLDVSLEGDSLEEAVEEAMPVVAETVRLIRSGVFPPAAGAAEGSSTCRSCPHLQLCRKGPSNRVSTKLAATPDLSGAIRFWVSGGGADAEPRED
ncbi:MAG TPA: PD-(D/E)XK nuclease family protein [Candidatus Fermentibacter daniensis]|nr:PD-(D/E)XK nuclease family protein [Candidatus Fermentibacter daniensis]